MQHKKGHYSSTIILPTLNEAGNIKHIISELLERFPGSYVIVADDGSVDGTGKIVGEISKTEKRVIFLDRKNEREHGLTASVIDSVLIAKGDKIVVMDADLQHPVSKVNDLFSGLEDSDIVIGVRRSVKNWSFGRMVISRCMESAARCYFRIRGRRTCGDMMSGFFAVRSGVFKMIVLENREKFVGRGYKILLDILRLSPSGIKISEVRYSAFHMRKRGRSKLGFRHVIYTLASLFS